jgi:membrane protein DedA with SNARE-associated domain
MIPDQPRTILSYVVVFMVLLGTFYALVLYPYELDPLVKGGFLSSSGMALQWVFGSATAAATARQQQKAVASQQAPTEANS